MPKNWIAETGWPVGNCLKLDDRHLRRSNVLFGVVVCKKRIGWSDHRLLAIYGKYYICILRTIKRVSNQNS